MTRIYTYILLGVLFGTTAVITSCQRDEEVVVSTITTNKPTYVHSNNAGISVELDYNGTPKQYGICYGTETSPTIKNDLALCIDSAAQLCELLNLEPATTYYARAFVQNRSDVLYGNEISFTTAERLVESGHEYVDMGLSVKWATMNVGATVAEEGGKYFAWGEVDEKESYMWDNYHYGNSRTTLTKYCESEEYGTVDNKAILDLWDDAAYMIWGGKWRMPTYNEWDELMRNSTWTWVEQNGVKGVRVRSTKNGNCIFLPTTGYKVGADLNYKDDIVCFWSSSLSKNGSYMSYGVSVETPNNTASFYGFNRYNGYPIRAVMDNAITPPAVDIPVVVTSAASEITKNSAVVGGNVVSDGGLEVTERGVYYSMSANPIETGTKVECGSGLGEFTYNLTSLQTGATYYVCAYAKNKFGVAYGEEISFVCEGVPVVTTLQPTNISYISATIGGNVIDDGGLEVTERGVCYSTSTIPTTADAKITGGSGIGSFTCNLTDLQEETTYYARAYATNAKGTAYGEEVSFTTTKEGEGIENGYVYMDLGLSVKWATMNVGASKAEDYGSYFAWGETSTKTTYNWSTYKYCNGSSSTLTKYNNSSSYGTVDNKTQLELTDDAAAVNWGGAWRMPTDAELTELREQCTWTWTTQNGVNGYKVTSKKSGYTNNSIFLPAAGYRLVSSLYYAGSEGYYWLSSLNTDNPYNAGGVYFNWGNVYRSYVSRYYGQSIRPVLGESVVETTIPTVTTTIPNQITETSALGGGNVISDGGATVTERGVVYGTNQNPTTSNTKITAGSGTGSFTCNLTGLQANTTYYVRAYAVNSKGTAYGEEVSFTTNGTENGYAYVDLGLSVKWATCNVGANNPEDYGDYFAWGETTTKDTYSWSIYKWCNGSETTLTKYCNNSSYGNNGFTDNKTQLELSDDAARANWGGSWRMPTDAEWIELMNNCTDTWTTQNGVNGYRVTSKTNGNSIFLPAAGCRRGSLLDGAGREGDYWSSSLSTYGPYGAWNVYYSSSDVGWGYGLRYSGLSVRPVCP